MTHHWLLITFSWFGSVSLQYINSGGHGDAEPMGSSVQYPYPYVNFLNQPGARNDYDNTQAQNEPSNDYFYPRHELQRKRRWTKSDVEEKEEIKDRRWLPNLIDTDKTMYLANENQVSNPFVINIPTAEDNSTSYYEPMEKRYFSPWGGKRSDKTNSWTWKRALNVREPSMPKRVRFSPWGGKRSGQMIYKPGNKGSKIILSNLPDLTRIVSNYSPDGKERLNLAGFQLIPTFDKRHPIKFMAMSARTNEKTLREALPFKTFLESLPKMFKHGHPYLDVNLNKDGKRKVKFSAWGGKRSPPIIGPIWTPAPSDVKESTLNSILLLRNSQDNEQASPAL